MIPVASGVLHRQHAVALLARYLWEIARQDGAMASLVIVMTAPSQSTLAVVAYLA